MKRAALNLIVLAGGLLAAAGLAEGLVRLVLPQDHLIRPLGAIEVLSPPGAATTHHFDPRFGLMLDPEIRYRQEELDYVFEVQTNSEGFRSPEFGALLSAGKPPILVTGDSFLWGTGVAVGERMIDHVAAELTDYAWVNLSLFATGTDQHYFYWRHYHDRLWPKLVIEFVYTNDLFDNTRRFNYEPKPYFALSNSGELIEKQPQPAEKPASRWVPRSLRHFLRERSHLYALLKDRLTPQHGGPPLEAYLKNPPEAVRRQFHLLTAILTRYAAEVRQTGTHFAVVVIPNKVALMTNGVYAFDDWGRIVEGQKLDSDQYDLDRIEKEIFAWGALRGVPVFSFLPYFREQERPDDPLHFDHDDHWSLRGNRVAAEVFVERFWPTLREMVESE